MRNKKGFTLIELLSVIVLIGIVATIAVVGFNSVRKSILNRQYKNLIVEIKSAAMSYFKDTEDDEISIKYLIEQGYLKADDKSLSIYDPRNKRNMNCDILSYNFETDDIAHNEVQIDANGQCSNDNNSGRYATVLYSEDGVSYSPVKKDYWYNKIGYLKASINGELINPKYEWYKSKNTNLAGANESILDLNSIMNEGSIINELFSVKITDGTSIYNSKGVRLQIDTKMPTAKLISYEPSNQESVKELKITYKIEDDGSGLKEYTFQDTDCSENQWTNTQELNGEKVKTITITLKEKTSDNYYLCVSDNAGNQSNPIVEDFDGGKIKEITGDDVIGYYDGQPEKGDWTNLNRTITYKCKSKNTNAKCTVTAFDCKTGIKITETSKKFGKENSGEVYGRINAKEYNMCFRGTLNNGDYVDFPNIDPTLVNVYVDNAKPVINSISIDSSVSAYNSKNVNIKLNVSDKGSGIKSIVLKTNQVSNIVLYESPNQEIKNVIETYNVNIANDYSRSSNTITVTIIVTDYANNVTKSNYTYHIYKICSEHDDTVISTGKDQYCVVSSTGCDGRACGQGGRFIYNNYNDKYISGEMCSVNVGSEKCNVPCDDSCTNTPTPGNEERTINACRCHAPSETIVYINKCVTQSDGSELCDGVYNANDLKTDFSYCPNSSRPSQCSSGSGSTNPGTTPKTPYKCWNENSLIKAGDTVSIHKCVQKNGENQCCYIGTSNYRNMEDNYSLSDYSLYGPDTPVSFINYSCHLPAGTYCVDGGDSNSTSNLNFCAECSSNSDCAGSLKCLYGKCAYNPSERQNCSATSSVCGKCNINADCKAGDCVNGQCRTYKAGSNEYKTCY